MVSISTYLNINICVLCDGKAERHSWPFSCLLFIWHIMLLSCLFPLHQCLGTQSFIVLISIESQNKTAEML